MLKIEPNVEGACGGNVHLDPHFLESLKNMVTLSLEMLLQSDLKRRRVSQREACSFHQVFDLFLLDVICF